MDVWGLGTDARLRRLRRRGGPRAAAPDHVRVAWPGPEQVVRSMHGDAEAVPRWERARDAQARGNWSSWASHPEASAGRRGRRVAQVGGLHGSLHHIRMHKAVATPCGLARWTETSGASSVARWPYSSFFGCRYGANPQLLCVLSLYPSFPLTAWVDSPNSAGYFPPPSVDHPGQDLAPVVHVPPPAVHPVPYTSPFYSGTLGPPSETPCRYAVRSMHRPT